MMAAYDPVDNSAASANRPCGGQTSSISAHALKCQA